MNYGIYWKKKLKRGRNKFQRLSFFEFVYLFEKLEKLRKKKIKIRKTRENAYINNRRNKF